MQGLLTLLSVLLKDDWMVESSVNSAVSVQILDAKENLFLRVSHSSGLPSSFLTKDRV